MKKQLAKGIFLFSILLSILLCFSCQQASNNNNKTDVDNNNDTVINDTTTDDTVPDDEGTDDEGTDDEGTEGEESEDEETEIIKTRDECERDIAAVKKLIEIPKTAIAKKDGFVYCDLPIAVQGYKDVSISWESNSSYFAIDNDVGILSDISTTQLITLTATISCGDYSDKKSLTIKAYPKNSALTQTECLDAAIFALSFGEKIRNLNNEYVIYTSVLQYMDFEQMSNIKITVSSEDPSVELTAPTSMSSAYKINIKKAPVQKIVKITVNFEYSGMKKTRIYYIDVKSDKTEFAGAYDHKEYGSYKFEDNKLRFTASKSSYYDAIYNYVISDTDNKITLSVEKKRFNGKWYTKKEWINVIGNNANSKRHAEYEFFKNKVFSYEITSQQVFSTGSNINTEMALTLIPEWDSSTHWTLQYGRLVEKENDRASFKLPVCNDEFDEWHNSSESSFTPLKDNEGTFNSDYTQFYASGKTWTVTQYDSSGKHYVDFVFGNETHTFYYSPTDLCQNKW